MEMYLSSCGCVVLNVMECVNACTGEVSKALAKIIHIFYNITE